MKVLPFAIAPLGEVTDNELRAREAHVFKGPGVVKPSMLEKPPASAFVSPPATVEPCTFGENPAPSSNC